MEKLDIYHIIYMGFIQVRWLALGFLNHQQIAWISSEKKFDSLKGTFIMGNLGKNPELECFGHFGVRTPFLFGLPFGVA